MNIKKKGVAIAMVLMIGGFSFVGMAQINLGSLGSTLGNIAQGVLSKSDLTVDDIAGEWTASGSAVSFQGDNFLKKAGGLAAAGVIEDKINPYFEKLGLNNAVLTIKDDGTFKLKVKSITLSGTLESNGDGSFIFAFSALGKVSLGKVNSYVQKSGNNMDVMFDAKKLMDIVSGVAKLTGISVAKTAASLLDSYDGLCVGFGMTKTGNVESTKPASSASSSSKGAASVIGNILGGGKTETQQSAPTETSETENSESSGSTTKKMGENLYNLLKGSGNK